MNFETLNRNMKAARRGRNLFALMTVMLMAILLMMASALNSTTRTTVLVPSRISDGMVSNGNVDLRYVEAISLDAVYSFYNLSPETASYSRSAIEKIAAVRTRPELLEAFDEVADDLRERRLTTTFFVNRIDHDWDKLQITVTGYLNTFIETKSTARVERTVRLTFVPEAHSVRLAALEVLEGDV